MHLSGLGRTAQSLVNTIALLGRWKDVSHIEGSMEGRKDTLTAWA